MKLIDITIEAYLELVGSDAPAPGGGSASALCGAQGAGLLAMAARLTTGKEKYAAAQETCARVIAGADTVCRKLAEQVDIDTEAYNGIASAFKLPRGTDEEKSARQAAIRAAAIYAAEVPLETMRLGVQGLEYAEELMGNYNMNCASDVGCGVNNLLCCVRGAHLNVQINIGGTADDRGLLAAADALAVRAEKLAENLLEQIRGCL